MAGFAEGFRTGGGLVQQVIENQRQAELDARTGEEHAHKKELWKRENEAQAREDTAYQGLQNVRQGITPEYLAQAKERYGADDARLAEWGKLPGGLPAKLAQLDQFNSQIDETGATRAQPAPVAQGLQLGKPDSVAEAQALGDIAVAKRDVAGIRAARTDVRLETARRYADAASKMKSEDVLAYLEKNANVPGGMPMSIAQEPDKKGYRLMAWDKNGKSKQMLLNDAQARKLVQSHLMMENGMGPEGLELASSIHKDLDEIVKGYNAGVKDQVTIANTVTHQGRTDDLGAERNQIARGALKVAQDKAEREKWKPIGPSEDNKGLLLIDEQGNTKVNPLPPGTDATKIWNKIKGSGGKVDTTEHAVPEEGSRVRVGDKILKYDRDGSKIPDSQLTTTEMEKVMIDAGITPEMVGGSIKRDVDGTLILGMKRYDPKKDMNELRGDVEQLGRNNLTVETENRYSPHADPTQQRTQLQHEGRGFVPF